MDYTVHGILQARILEWVAVPFSRGSSDPGIELGSPALQADSLPMELSGKPYLCECSRLNSCFSFVSASWYSNFSEYFFNEYSVHLYSVLSTWCLLSDLIEGLKSGSTNCYLSGQTSLGVSFLLEQALLDSDIRHKIGSTLFGFEAWLYPTLAGFPGKLANLSKSERFHL